MDFIPEKVYDRALAAIALMGLIAFTHLSFAGGSFAPEGVYAGLIFIALTFLGYFLLSVFLSDQDPALLLLASFLSELGIIMLYRIDPEVFFKQINWYIFGMLVFILSSLISRYWVELHIAPHFLFAATALLLLSPLLVGVERGGSKSWIEFSSFYFQPSELAKITFSLFLARSLEEGEIKDFWIFLGEFLVVLGLLAAARDLGGAMLFYITALAMVCVATSQKKFLIAGVGAGALAAVLGYFAFGHVRVRVEAWLNPWQDVAVSGYQIVQSLLAMASGGYLGTGLGLGRPDFIPAVTTDFIFSAFFEEFGYLGAAAVIVMYFLLVYRGIRISLTAENSFLSLAALSITTFFAFQAFTIIGGVIKFIPLTGVTLPFMSYGGSSMVMSFFSLGILNGIWARVQGDVDGEDEDE